MTVRILTGDALERLRELPDASVHACVTSPPYYGLRDYGTAGQIGLEDTPAAYIARLVAVFREVHRVLRGDGTLWLNIGDSYAAGTNARNSPQPKGSRSHPEQWANARIKAGDGLKPKDLIGIPWMLAFALRDDGWHLRQDIIWHKPNPMPESVTDRCTKAHEYVFLMSKGRRYHYDAAAIAETLAAASVDRLNQAGLASQAGSLRVPGKTNGPMKAVARKPSGVYSEGSGRNDGNPHPSGGWVTNDTLRNARSVWPITTHPYAGAHFATMPPELAERCIKAGCPKGGTVLDPFGGAATTGLVADRLGRNAILIELNPAYVEIARERIRADAPMFADVTA